MTPRFVLAALLAHLRRIPDDIATVTVVTCLALVLAWIAYFRITHPRYDQWQPEELSQLKPPFSSAPGNGVRKIK